MRRISKKAVCLDGTEKRIPLDLAEKLNYNIAGLLNQSLINDDGLPIHHCNPSVYPDYIALNSEPGKFHITPLTAVSFYNYDKSFDKPNGLFNAIYYNNKKQLAKFKEKYKNVAFVVAPDYSMFDDIWRFENEYRLFKTRIIMLWFILEIKAVVIPNVPYLSTNALPLFLSGFENCTVMCFSTKGHVRYAKSRNRIRENVKYAVDNYPLKTILVYSVCGKDSTSLELFDYAKEKGIDVHIIDNTMRRRNQKLLKEAIA